jgi:hypothetical protein
MKRKPATLEQKAWIMRVKTCPCIICNPEWFEGEVLPEYYHGNACSEYHHICDTGRRLGHDFGLSLCTNHHRGNDGFSGKNRGAWGKSLKNQLALCKKIYRKFGREFKQPTSKIVSRKYD